MGAITRRAEEASAKTIEKRITLDTLMLLHVGFMTFAAICIITASVTGRRKKDGWFPRHRKLALLGVVLALAAFCSIFVLKYLKGYPHLTSPHGIAGAVSLCLLIITPVLGMLLVKGNEGLRQVHRAFGRITSLAVLFTAVIGALRFLQILKR